MTRAPRKPRGPLPPRQITADLVRDALSFIPPDIGHDERARIAFAVFDGLGDAGEDPWLDWAAMRGKADAAADRSTWKSARKSGPVKVGTLFGIAKDHGFTFPEPNAAAPAPDPAVLAAAAAAAERKRQADEAQYRERADKAARVARQMWADASDEGRSPYLERKGVQAHGVRFMADGTLLVPMHDANGELQNLQRIAPTKPADDAPEKRYLPSGRKSGLFHLIGWSPTASTNDAAPADPGADDGLHDSTPAVLLLCEGYATGSSLHEATGQTVAVCFDAGNLKHVAQALRELHPTALLLICGDDDRDTEARTGTNPGRVKAAAAARAANTDVGPAVCVFPDGLPDGASDFNDLAAHAGAGVVCAQVEAAFRAACADALPAEDAAPPDAEQPTTEATPAPSPKKRPKARASQVPDDIDSPASDEGGGDRFRVSESGVWFKPPAGDDGTTGSARRVCDRLEVLALARDMQDKGGALLLDFDTAFGKGRRWLMPLAMLAGDGAEYRRELLDMGFRAPTDAKRRPLLTQYLESRRPAERVRLVDRVGWQGKAYVLPRETLCASDAEPGESLMFHSDAPMEDTFTQRGTLAQWQERVGRYCVGNSRLMLAVSTALAAPLLPWVPSVDAGGVNFRGNSSTGKSTTLRVASSVNGGKDYTQSWRATSNGLEAVAAQHCHSLLCLDEFSEVDPKEAGETIYMLGNGQGKLRGNRNGGNRPRLTWSLFFLSAAEIALSQHMAEAGKRTRAGQDLRMIDLPADAGAGLGVFETVHEHEGGAALSQHLTKACTTTYGTLGRAWLEWLTSHAGEFHQALRTHVDELVLAFVPDTADGQVQRAGRRFALIAAAGELATRQGLTGWPEGAATEGVKRCFLAWVAARPAGFGNSERADALRQVRGWLEKNGDALFTWWHRAMDDHKPNTALRCGFKRIIDEQGNPVKFDSATDYGDARAPVGERTADAGLVEYLVFPEQFKTEACKGLDSGFVAQVLKDAGFLKHDAGHLTRRHRLPGIGLARAFHILPSIFSGDGV